MLTESIWSKGSIDEVITIDFALSLGLEFHLHVGRGREAMNYLNADELPCLFASKMRPVRVRLPLFASIL